MTERDSSKNTIYVKNPDVLVKEEDDHGALVFNPDNDKIMVFNSTALFIWNQCNGRNDKKAIIALLYQNFENIPEDEVVDQVEKNLDMMASSGFIGNILEKT